MTELNENCDAGCKCFSEEYQALCRELNQQASEAICVRLPNIALQLKELSGRAENLKIEGDAEPPKLLVTMLREAKQLGLETARLTDLLEAKMNEMLCNVRISEEINPIVATALKESLSLLDMLKGDLNDFINQIGSFYADRAFKNKRVHDFPNQPPEAYGEFDRQTLATVKRSLQNLCCLVVSVQKTLKRNVLEELKKNLKLEEEFLRKLYM